MAAAAATRALNSAAPTATALPRQPTSMAEVYSGATPIVPGPRRRGCVPRLHVAARGCAVRAAATMRPIAGPPGRPARRRPRGRRAGHLGVAERSSARPTSMRVRPDRSGLTQPDAAYRLGHAAAPSTTSPASCGQRRRVWSTSTSDAAIRGDRSFGVQVAQDVRDLVPAAHPAAAMRCRVRRADRAGWAGPVPGRNVPRRPGRGHWSPSAPECRRAFAASRTSAFMSSESHSSTTMSSPSRNSSTVSWVNPASSTSTGR